VALTAPGSTNTKSAWTQLSASAPFDVAGLWVTVSAGGANGSALFDIGIGGAGSEQVIVPNVPVRRNGGANFGSGPIVLPVAIPAGTRIAARYQSSATTNTLVVGALLVAAAWNTAQGGNRVAAYGAVTATGVGTVVDPGGSANTKGAWVEVASATDFDSSWLLLSVLPSGTLLSAQSWQVDVAVGASGSEQVVIPDVYIYGSSTVDNQVRLALPFSIPAGSRIAVRAQCSSTTTPGREREVVVHLIG
jgi:hypothetical protein